MPRADRQVRPRWGLFCPTVPRAQDRLERKPGAQTAAALLCALESGEPAQREE